MIQPTVPVEDTVLVLYGYYGTGCSADPPGTNQERQASCHFQKRSCTSVSSIHRRPNPFQFQPRNVISQRSIPYTRSLCSGAARILPMSGFTLSHSFMQLGNGG